MNIESYHGVLKRWFALNTKGLRGRNIDWLVWQLATTIAYLSFFILKYNNRPNLKNYWDPQIKLICKKLI